MFVETIFMYDDPLQTSELLSTIKTLQNRAHAIASEQIFAKRYPTLSEMCRALSIHAELLLNIRFYATHQVQLNDLQTYATEILRFLDSISTVDGWGNREGLNDPNVSIFSDYYRKFIAEASRIISIYQTTVNGGGANQSAEEARKVLEAVSKARDDANNLRGEISRTLEAAKQDATAVNTLAKHRVLETYGSDFSKSATAHRNASRLWLSVVLALVVLVVYLGISTYDSEIDIFSNGTKIDPISKLPVTNPTLGLQIIAFLATRLLVASAIFVALNLAIKNYKISKHNQLSQEHRQLALSTFETFMRESNEDSQTKNAVLLEVCRTIFSLQASGYTANDSESEGPSKIIEIFKGIPIK